MAWIVQNEEEMVGMIRQVVAEIRGEELTMLPMIIGNSPDEARKLLLKVEHFQPKTDGDGLPVTAAGLIRVNKDRTVHDLLNDLEQLSMNACSDLDVLLKCVVQTPHVPGKTRKVNLALGKMMGWPEMVVDLQMLSKASGLPIKGGEGLEYTVFVREVPDRRNNDVPRTVTVFVKGTSDPGNGGGSDRILQPLIARLIDRTKSGHEPGMSFHAQDLEDGWMLYNNKLFPEVLGWVKRGYWQSVGLDQNKGGIVISF